MTRMATTGVDKVAQLNTFRSHLRRLIGKANLQTPQVQDSIEAWARSYTTSQVDAIWEEANAQTDKPHLWYLVDTLNGKQKRKRGAKGAAIGAGYTFDGGDDRA